MCEILFPVGRMVSGSFTKAYPRLDSDGKEIADKDPVYSFGYAIPKTGEASWQQTAWGQQIKKVADDIKEVLKITPLPAIKRQEVPEEPKKTEFKINRPPEKKPSVVAKILKPLEESKKEVVASSQALEETVKPQSIIAKRNEVVLETQNNFHFR